MVTSSITGGREWPLASSENLDKFWREFQREVFEILTKYPQLTTAKKLRGGTEIVDPEETSSIVKVEKDKEDEDTTEGGDEKKNSVIIRKVILRYNDDIDEECDALLMNEAAAKVRTMYVGGWSRC